MISGLHQNSQLRMWTTEANSFWDRSCLGPSSSARRQVCTPDICALSLKEESLPAESALTTETQERASLPGLLIKANRIMRGTSSKQRQLKQLTPEIARCHKANVRILLTEVKTTHHHQNPALPPQPVLGTATHPKS